VNFVLLGVNTATVWLAWLWCHNALTMCQSQVAGYQQLWCCRCW